jgi:hypothetical protein
MKAPQLFSGALTLAIALSGCHRPASKADVQQTASDAAAKVKVEGAKAREQLADAWLATKIQSKFVGDREIKATDIDVSSRDGVVAPRTPRRQVRWRQQGRRITPLAPQPHRPRMMHGLPRASNPSTS